MEAPYLTKLAEKYSKDGFTVVAVNGWDEPKGVVKSFATQKNLAHTILLMGARVAEQSFGVRSYPTNFWIDHDGKVLRREMGFHTAMLPAMEAKIVELLKKRKLAGAAKTGGG